MADLTDRTLEQGLVQPAPGHPVDELAPPPRKPWWPRIVAGLLLLVFLVIAWLAITAPLGRALEPLEHPAVVLTAADGTPIAQRGSYKEEPVDVTALPPHVGNAFIAIEDKRFRQHFGIDLRGIARAMVANAQAGRIVEGGSTLTQQLAKTSFLTLDRSYVRKAQEVLIALWLEAWLTKDEILSRYLSSVYFGDGAYGIRAAARTYFDKQPDQLTVPEAAMLAGLVKAPSRLAPTKNYAGARARGKLVIQAMIDNGYLTRTEANRLQRARINPGRARLANGSHFADWVWPDAAERLEGQYGEARVRTTLDRQLQRKAERVIAAELKRQPWLKASEAALVAMRPDGTVVAMVGGRDYTASSFNRATQAKRQPGSAFKLFVYLAALRDGWSIDDPIEDTPVTIGDWSPRNHEGKYRGTISLRSAFAASSNVAAARLANEVGSRAIIRAARDLGVTAPLSRDLTMALGTSDMTLIELTAAYAAIANGAYPVRPRGLDEPGTPGWTTRVGASFRALSGFPERDAMEQLLLSAVRNGTGSAARLPIPAYGKTGTTQDYRDAIFVGYAGDLVVGVWVGNDDNSPMNGVTGAGLPARIWRSFMRDALPQLRAKPKPVLPEPEPFEIDIAAEGIEGAVDAAIDPAVQARIDAGADAVDAVGDLIDATTVEGESPAERQQRIEDAVERLRDAAEAAN